MNKVICKQIFKKLFAKPCTIKYWDGETEQIGEGESRFTLIFNEPISEKEIMADPSIAFGEAYMYKKIDIEGSIKSVIEAIYCKKDNYLSKNSLLKSKLFRKAANSIKKSKDNAQFHYDIGNDFYSLWLDETMTYSCAYFKTQNDSLTAAQRNKAEHILKKLNLKPDMTLLDIGCGWGELIIAAAKKYNVKATGITLSSEQYYKVKERIERESLKELVDVQLTDYREISNRKFDRIISVGMLEHVGKQNLKQYFSTVNKLLEKNGISLLHCITGLIETDGGTNSWINKYIFPGGYIPAIQELVRHIAEAGFYLVDAESLRMHYAKTLDCWAENFERKLPEISKTKDETFIRMWRLYLNACAASFECGNIDIHQFLFTKGPNNELPLTREYMYNS